MKVTQERYNLLRKTLTPEELDLFEFIDPKSVEVYGYLSTAHYDSIIESDRGDKHFIYEAHPLGSYVVPVKFDCFQAAQDFAENLDNAYCG